MAAPQDEAGGRAPESRDASPCSSRKRAADVRDSRRAG